MGLTITLPIGGGPPGPTGPTGPSGGPTGPTGASGPPGLDGLDGTKGAPGVTGPVGATGVGNTGPQGTTGSTGPIGVDGPQGPVGASGAQGNSGAQGLVGNTGPQGFDGLDGAVGFSGPTGPQGTTGNTGPQGNTGTTGPVGNTGATGPQGLDGLDGSAGAPGLAGSTGPLGPQGLDGLDGAGGGAVGGDLLGTLPNPMLNAGRAYRSKSFISGAYYGLPGAVGETAGGTMSTNVLKAIPFPVGITTTFNSIALSNFIAGSAGSVVRLGIYLDDGAIGPNTLVLDAVTYDASTTGRKEIGISQQLTPGLYWLAMVPQNNGASTGNFRRISTATSANAIGPYTFQGWNGNNDLSGGCFFRAGVSGALPTTLTPTRADFEGGGDMPMIMLRVA